MGDPTPIGDVIPGQLELVHERAEARRAELVRLALAMIEAARDLAAAAAWGPELHLRSEADRVQEIAAAIRAAAATDEGGSSGD